MYPATSPTTEFSYSDEFYESEGESYQHGGYPKRYQAGSRHPTQSLGFQQQWPHSQRHRSYGDEFSATSVERQPYMHHYGMDHQGDGSLDLMSKMTELIDCQSSLKGIVENLSSRMTTIERNVVSSPCNSSLAGSSVQEVNQRIPRKLTTTVGDIHDSLNEESQFKLELSMKDPHNRSVRKKIEEEVVLRNNEKYSAALVQRSTKRLFEQRRRNLRESDPDQRERVLKQERSRKIRSRKNRLYKRREKVVLEGQETEKFEQLGLEYVSEESSGDEEGVVTVHQPEWRSSTLSSFFNVLDRRADENRKSLRKHVPERKRRVIGSPLKNAPPKDAPTWTICSEWLADQEEP